MFDRISNGFSLAGSTWRVLTRDKHLIAFPLVSGFCFLLVMLSFAVPLIALVDWNGVQQQMQANKGKPPVWTYAVAFAFYFCTYFVIIFCNSALISCAIMRFNGGNPTLGDGFRMAMARLPQIFAWSLVSATVGVLLNVIENIDERVGQFVSWLLGSAWSIMTFFVVPVLVVEKVGPMQAVGRSLSILRKTWGEALVGNMGLNFILFLLFIPVVLVFVVGILLLVQGMVPAGIAVLVVAGVLFLLHMAVSSALSTIFLAALYQYAADGRVPEGFDGRAMEGAFGRG
jgi:hypothetical protein